MNSDNYCETMEEEVLIPSAQTLLGESYIYQQDNTLRHKCRSTMKWSATQDIEELFS